MLTLNEQEKAYLLSLLRSAMQDDATFVRRLAPEQMPQMRRDTLANIDTACILIAKLATAEAK